MYYLLCFICIWFHEILSIYFSLVEDSLKSLINKSGTFHFLIQHWRFKYWSLVRFLLARGSSQVSAGKEGHFAGRRGRRTGGLDADTAGAKSGLALGVDRDTAVAAPMVDLAQLDSLPAGGALVGLHLRLLVPGVLLLAGTGGVAGAAGDTRGDLQHLHLVADADAARPSFLLPRSLWGGIMSSDFDPWYTSAPLPRLPGLGVCLIEPCSGSRPRLAQVDGFVKAEVVHVEHAAVRHVRAPPPAVGGLPHQPRR